MRTYKTLGGALAAILSLILTQLIAQGAADLLAMIKLPAGVCNIISGILYAGLAYAALRLLSEKVLHEHTAALGMPKLHIQPRWAITAVLLPLAVTGCYLLLFRGTFVRADMRGDEMFSTLSAGIAFTGIAAGFVEEMVFRGVILNLFAQRWNKIVAVIEIGFHFVRYNSSVGKLVAVQVFPVPNVTFSCQQVAGNNLSVSSVIVALCLVFSADVKVNIARIPVGHGDPESARIS